VKKVAFLALTYSDFAKSDLMQKFFSKSVGKRCNLYIHNKLEINSPFFKKFVIPDEYKIPTEWAKYSLVHATIRLMLYALLHDTDNEKFILISDTHCPVYSCDEVCRLIFEKFPILSFSREVEYDNAIKQRFTRMQNPLIDSFPFHIKDAAVVSQWFICNRANAERFVHYELQYRKLFNHNRIIFADEMYFHLLGKHFKMPMQYKRSCHFNWNLDSPKFLIDAGNHARPKIYPKISNKFVDVLRNNTDCLFMRKVYSGTVIDEDYLLQSNDCKTNY